ncbi:disease resistance protein RGA5-like isoform X2 [Miscanthus floridulus]|uniref:disease resistance protein RGA5-like isoform X2 n=1 Tax=Miscanthus floridulus TaxID=154761 RepID=UPI003458D511
MATAAVVGVTTGVMKPLLSKLTKLLEEEYVKLKGVRKQIKFLRDELSAMSATLEMLADAEELNPQTRKWRDKLRELAYDLEDCIDAFMVRVDHEHDGHSGLFKRFFRKLKKLRPRHEIANQIQELKPSVIEASERHKRYQLVDISSNSRSTCAVDPRLSALYVEIDKLVGIDCAKKYITEWLTMETKKASSSELKVLSIVGCGGLAFVSVSRTPDVRKVLRGIAKGVGITSNMLDDDEKELIDKLREHLQDKRYLIVIDDVWDAKPWETIKLALMNNNCGSRIITTTRSNDVASYLSSQGGNVYQMKSLSFEDSKRLLFKRAFGSENLRYTHLGTAPDEILKKCDGLPLAIITISSMLADQHAKGEWDSVLNDIGSSLAKNPGAENMTAILSMSYFDIPHHLRSCLLYLSVFPEDYEIEKQCLINRWIAEGFIHKEKGQNEYEIGERYFNDLINRSMIQPLIVKYGQVKTCQVHDIILDYIKCKAAEENFVTSLDAAEPVYTSEYKVRRLFVSNDNEENVTLWADQILSHVRSVTIFGEPVKISLLPSTPLRVLDQRSMQNHHLASIGKLFNLKYLRLCSRSITRLPETVGELHHLQTLDVRGTCIEELPRTITELQQLTRLYVDWYTRFPEGTIGKMHSLEELRKYGVKSYGQAKSIQEFSKLTKLRTLKIRCDFHTLNRSEGRSQAERIHSYVGNLLSSCNLHHLIYTNVWDSITVYPLPLHSWHPAASCSIRKLCIERIPIYRVPNWMGSLGNLGVLELEVMCVRPEDVEILGEIPSLVFLNLDTWGGTSGRIVFPGNNGFRSLKQFSLCIKFCGTSLEFEAGSMSNLEHVKLQFSAHDMECLNGASSLGIQHLSSLNKAEIEIGSDWHEYDVDYNPVEDDHDDTARCISRAINAAIETLPNRPTASFKIQEVDCKHFESFLREWNQYHDGLFNEWLKLWQIREEPANQPTDGETELEDETHEKEEEEQTDEEETSEEEVARQDDTGSSN